MIKRIEIDFAIPVVLSEQQERAIADLVQEIAKDNEPEGHVHWHMESGHKPIWSRADRRFMGLPDDPNAPEKGEPAFDDTVLHFGTSCRERYESEKKDGA